MLRPAPARRPWSANPQTTCCPVRRPPFGRQCDGGATRDCVRVEIDANLVDIDNLWPTSARTRPISATSAAIGQIWSTSTQISPDLANLGQTLVKVGSRLFDIGRVRPKSARLLSTSAKFGQLGPNLKKNGPHWVNFGPHSVESGHRNELGSTTQGRAARGCSGRHAPSTRLMCPTLSFTPSTCRWLANHRPWRLWSRYAVLFNEGSAVIIATPHRRHAASADIAPYWPRFPSHSVDRCPTSADSEQNVATPKPVNICQIRPVPSKLGPMMDDTMWAPNWQTSAQPCPNSELAHIFRPARPNPSQSWASAGPRTTGHCELRPRCWRHARETTSGSSRTCRNAFACGSLFGVRVGKAACPCPRAKRAASTTTNAHMRARASTPRDHATCGCPGARQRP